MVGAVSGGHGSYCKMDELKMLQFKVNFILLKAMHILSRIISSLTFESAQYSHCYGFVEYAAIASGGMDLGTAVLSPLTTP